MPLRAEMKMTSARTSEPQRQRSVLIADDHPLMRRVLRELIEDEADLRVVGEARDGAEAIERFRALRPDATLMDLQMPRFDGIRSIERIRAIEPAAPIVVLTSFAGDARIRRATEAGATAYVLKTANGAEVVGVLRDALNGHAGVATTEAVRVNAQLDRCELTRRELSVLREIANGKSNHSIGKALHVSVETVKTRIKKILQKLGADDRAHAVALAARRGYLDYLGP
jgi:DNA-binding NarL/FixJ family response regulator